MHEDHSEGIYLTPQEWEAVIQRMQTAQPLLPKPGTKTPEPGSPSSATDPPEVDPHEDLRKYIPNNPDIDLSLPMKQSTYSSSMSSFTTSLFDSKPVIRIMKKAVPSDALISDAAKGDMGRCVVEFIQFLTSEGSFKPNPFTHSRSLGTETTLPL